MKNMWWKIAGLVLVLYSLIAGLLIRVPDLPVIHESIRNIFYHVCMWFNLLILLSISCINAVRYLAGFNEKFDLRSVEAASTGVFFGLLGLVTGSIWARFSWGVFWTNDPQLNGASASMLIYGAYFVLRKSVNDEEKRARISAVYNIFAYVMMIIFLLILPKLAQGSVHPGKGGNPMALTDLDATMRLVFYPAVVGWIFVGIWIYQIKLRIRIAKEINGL
ncbi:MAG: cytochrome c biogenesis protein CcsA [Bacteroidota bacterium]|nr:cytochrome c biogenesis protein CcsA [Bacteroidota bacterium]